jgi:hypothetical protein
VGIIAPRTLKLQREDPDINNRPSNPSTRTILIVPRKTMAQALHIEVNHCLIMSQLAIHHRSIEQYLCSKPVPLEILQS